MAVEASWNGHQWVTDDGQVVSSDPNWGAEPSGALSRGAKGFAETTPFNPMNWLSMLKDLPGTAKSMVMDPLNSAGDALGDFKNVVTGGDPQGRLSAALKGVTHSVGAIPLVGQPILHNVSEKWADGDYAGGAGSVLGLASGALMPEAVKGARNADYAGGAAAVGRGVSAAGRGVEAASNAIKKPGLSALPIATIVGGHPLAGLAEAAAPWVGEYAGKGLQKVGGALEGLERGARRGSMPEVADMGNAPTPTVTDMGNVPTPAGLLRPARFSEEKPMAPADGWESMTPNRGKLLSQPESPALAGLMDDGLEPQPFDVVGDEPGVPQEQPTSAEVDGLTQGMLQEEPAPPAEGFDLGDASEYGDLDAVMRSLEEPQDAQPAPPSPELPGSLAAFNDAPATPETGPSYTDWSAGMDDIINGATEADMPRQHSKGLGSSRPTNAIKDWVNKRRAAAQADGSLATEVVR